LLLPLPVAMKWHYAGRSFPRARENHRINPRARVVVAGASEPCGRASLKEADHSDFPSRIQLSRN
jgi:hypothetical protein